MFSRDSNNKGLIDTEKKLIEDIYCRQLLNNLFEGYDQLPITKSSMSFFAIAMILNDIHISNRETILEFGSGLSTILMARLINKNKLSCKIYSVEHDKNWFALLNTILKKENTIENVVSIYAPLTASKKSKNNLEWYNEETILNSLPENILFDLVIIDGPPAHERSKSLSRYPALPFVNNKLKKSYSIYVDDASRNGEQEVINYWKEEYNFSFNLINNRIAHSSDDDFIQYSCLPC
jgi:predicted O-methyltransferase YrrM